LVVLVVFLGLVMGLECLTGQVGSDGGEADEWVRGQNAADTIITPLTTPLSSRRRERAYGDDNHVQPKGNRKRIIKNTMETNQTTRKTPVICLS
jgi:hypothetical protein